MIIDDRQECGRSQKKHIYATPSSNFLHTMKLFHVIRGRKDGWMKKRWIHMLLGITVLSFMFTGCSHQGTSDEITVYGQVAKIEGEHITIALAQRNDSATENSSDDNIDDTADTQDQQEEKQEDSREILEEDHSKIILTGEEQVVTVSDKTEVEQVNTESIADSAKSNEKKGSGTKEEKGGDTAGEENPEAFSEKQIETETAAIDDIETGDIIVVILDGAEAKSVTILPEAVSIEKQNNMDPSESGIDKGAKGSIEITAILEADGKSETSDDESLGSSKENESVVLVKNSGTLNMTNAKLTKAGDTSSSDESSFYGLNSVFVTAGGSESSISSSEITSASEGASGIFASGKEALIHVSHIKIETSGSSSKGLTATYGGTIDASDVDIATSGDQSPPVSAGRDGGTLKVTGGNITASGQGSPCIYSEGKVSAENLTGNSETGQIIVINGKNSAALEKCDFTGVGKSGIMLYQSADGDLDEDPAKLKVTDSRLTSNGEGPMFYVTNTKAEAVLANTELIYQGKTLVNVAGNDTNSWGTAGKNGGDFTLTGVGQKLLGNIVCDEISSAAIHLTEQSTLKGTVNGENKGKNVEISLDKDSHWELTGDSYVNVITNEDAGCSNIQSNGHDIYYDSSNAANSWLNNKTITLSGGGKLLPR